MTIPTKDMSLILMNPDTGETWDIDVLMDDYTDKWQKVIARELAKMLEIVGDEKTKVIAHLIKEKDYLNVVSATMKEIHEATGVSIKTVNTTIQIMKKHNFIVKVRNGKWRFSPFIMRHGKKGIGAAAITLYKEEQ